MGCIPLPQAGRTDLGYKANSAIWLNGVSHLENNIKYESTLKIYTLERKKAFLLVKRVSQHFKWEYLRPCRSQPQVLYTGNQP